MKMDQGAISFSGHRWKHDQSLLPPPTSAYVAFTSACDIVTRQPAPTKSRSAPPPFLTGSHQAEHETQLSVTLGVFVEDMKNS